MYLEVDLNLDEMRTYQFLENNRQHLADLVYSVIEIRMSQALDTHVFVVSTFHKLLSGLLASLIVLSNLGKTFLTRDEILYQSSLVFVYHRSLFLILLPVRLFLIVFHLLS